MLKAAMTIPYGATAIPLPGARSWSPRTGAIPQGMAHHRAAIRKVSPWVREVRRLYY